MRRLSKGDTAPVEKPKPVLNLATNERQAEVVKATADDIVTGSLQSDQPDQIVRKASAPLAKRPPVALLPDQASDNIQTASLTPAIATSKPAPLAQAKGRQQARREAARQPSAPEKPQASEQAEADMAQPQGWTVQLSSQRAPDAAWSVWKKLQARYDGCSPAPILSSTRPTSATAASITACASTRSKRAGPPSACAKASKRAAPLAL